MGNEYYTKTFYQEIRDGAMRSASVIAPIVLELLPVRSIVDIGCGDGSWLAVFRRLGVDDVVGVDGDHVEEEVLQIPTEYFRSFDLREPLSLERTFDLALSLEVAEHLPSDCAAKFVESLTRLSRVILFSAAIPYQGGNGHINEQWPDQWANLFEKHGYLPIDVIRKRVWQDDSVEWWYAQNVLLYAEKSFINSHASLRTEFELSNPSQLRVVHPRQFLYLGELYRGAVEHAERSPRPPSGVREASRLLLICLKNALKNKFLAISGKEKYSTKGRSAADLSPKN